MVLLRPLAAKCFTELSCDRPSMLLRLVLRGRVLRRTGLWLRVGVRWRLGRRGGRLRRRRLGGWRRLRGWRRRGVIMRRGWGGLRGPRSLAEGGEGRVFSPGGPSARGSPPLRGPVDD